MRPLRDQYAVPDRGCFFNDACRGTKMQKLLPMITLPELVTIPEAAKFLGVGRKVVYQMLDSGILRAIRIKSKIFIDPCCLNEFHNRGKMA